MSLENLLKIRQLKKHPADAREIQRLLAAAGRNLSDARVTFISSETRFDAAYKAIMQSALAALMAWGYRPDTNRPGNSKRGRTYFWCAPVVSGKGRVKPALGLIESHLSPGRGRVQEEQAAYLSKRRCESYGFTDVKNACS